MSSFSKTFLFYIFDIRYFKPLRPTSTVKLCFDNAVGCALCLDDFSVADIHSDVSVHPDSKSGCVGHT